MARCHLEPMLCGVNEESEQARLKASVEAKVVRRQVKQSGNAWKLPLFCSRFCLDWREQTFESPESLVGATVSQGCIPLQGMIGRPG